jgi:hypothetical protein
MRKPRIRSCTFTSPHTCVLQDSLVLRKKTLRQNPSAWRTESNTTQTRQACPHHWHSTFAPLAFAFVTVLKVAAFYCVCCTLGRSLDSVRPWNKFVLRIILNKLLLWHLPHGSKLADFNHAFNTRRGGVRPDLNVALNFSTSIISSRKYLFQIPVEAKFVSELSLTKFPLDF